jgi:predicted O-methyltransferase YrrM
MKSRVKSKPHDHYVTALHAESFKVLSDVLSDSKATTYCEIGTGYGASTLKLKQLFPDLKVITLEKKELVYLEAAQILSPFKDVTVVHQEALMYEPLQTFDVILIDAAKSQQQSIMEKYLPFLTPQGTMVIDNIHISRLKKEPPTRSRRALIKKHDAFINYLKNHPTIELRFLEVGDGMALIKKINR